MPGEETSSVYSPWERVYSVHYLVDPGLRFRQLIKAHALGRVYKHANRRRFFRANNLHGHDLDALGSRSGLKRVKQLRSLSC